MKIVIMGDSHGNVMNVKHVVGFAKKMKVGAVIHTGDWNNLKSLETVLEYNIPLYTVSGNADISPDIKSKLVSFLEVTIDNKKIAVVHKIHDIYKQKYNSWDIVFCGHYHSQSRSIYKRSNGDEYKVVRPGALEKEINFAVYDTKTNEVELIHE